MIKVFQPDIGAREMSLVLEALNAGEVSGHGGRFLERFEQEFAEYCDCRFGVAVSSGTAALHLAMAVLKIRAGDEALVSASTNIATANAVVMQDGIVVPIDAEPDTWNMNASLLEAAVTPSTRVIVPVHLFGHPVDMTAVCAVANKHGLYVVEDCAEAHGATFNGRKVGSLSDLGCFSFYANKIITTGEGGMLTTNDEELAVRARYLRNLAFGEPRFFHREVGFNYRMTNVQAAIGIGQLERIEETLEKKRRVAAWYTERLKGVPGLTLPVERDYARNVYWMYCVTVGRPFGETRDGLMFALGQAGIETRTMFCPMNLQPALLERGAVRRGSCPVAEALWYEGLYLPSSASLTEGEVDRVCSQVLAASCASTLS